MPQGKWVTSVQAYHVYCWRYWVDACTNAVWLEQGWDVVVSILSELLCLPSWLPHRGKHWVDASTDQEG